MIDLDPMASYRCEDCDELQIILPTGRKRAEQGSSEWWRVLAHWSKHTGQPCPGSGRLV